MTPAFSRAALQPGVDHAAALLPAGIVGRLAVFLPGMLLQTGAAIDDITIADKAAISFGHAVQISRDWREAHAHGSEVK